MANEVDVIDLKEGIVRCIREKFRDQTNFDIDCMVCVTLKDNGQEIFEKIHEQVRSQNVASSVSAQEEAEGSPVHDVSLEDALSKAETPPIKEQDPEADGASETTIVESNLSDGEAVKEDPVKEDSENKVPKDNIVKEADIFGEDEAHFSDVKEHIEEGAFDDISQEFDEIPDMEEHFTGDEANMTGEEEMFRFDSEMVQQVGHSKDIVTGNEQPCVVKTVQGQFDDLSEESQVEDTGALNDNSDTVKTAVIAQTSSRVHVPAIERFKETSEEIAVILAENVESIPVNENEHQAEMFEEETGAMQRMEEMGIIMEGVPDTNSTYASEPGISEEIENSSAERPSEITQAVPYETTVENCEGQSYLENHESDKDSDDIVLIDDEDDEHVEQPKEPIQPAEVIEDDEPEIQMTWEKPPPQRKRNYPMDTVNGNIPGNMAASYSSPALFPHVSNRSVVPAQNSVHLANAGPVEYSCGICAYKSTEYADLSNHLETAHEFHLFLSCIPCHEYFPNKYTFKIHRDMKHKDKSYFRCPHCQVGFGIEECQYHRQECRPDVQRTPTMPGNRPFHGQQNPVQNHFQNRQVYNVYPSTSTQPMRINSRSHGSYQQPSPQRAQRIQQNMGRFNAASQLQHQRQSPSPSKVPRVSSAPARAVLSTPGNVMPQSQSAPPRRKLDRSFQYVCDQCNTNFLTLKEYETHCLDTHNRYVCPVCSLSFPSQNVANRHLSMHQA